MEEKMKVETYDSLSREVKWFIDEAVVARHRARADYSHFKVGATVGLSTIERHCIASGCNVENSIFEVMHAEQAAIARLAMMCNKQEPMRIEIVATALLAETNSQHAVPCGLCRQWLREFGDDSMVIYGAKLNAEGLVWQVEIYTMGELLPYSFGPNNLNR